MKQTIQLVLGIALIGMLFNSCGNQSTKSNSETGDSTGVTDTEIVLGTFGPLTGPAALWGNITKGIDAHFKLINDEGGINGRKFRMIMKDDAYDPSRTVPAVRELVQKDEVFAFVGGIGTAPCLSIIDFMEEENVPWISPLSGSTHLTIPIRKNLFSVLPYYLDEGVIQAKYAVDSLGSKRIGIIYQNDDVGKSAVIGARHYLRSHGMELVAEVPVEPTDTDLSSHIARLKDSEAEVVLLWTLPRQAVITVTSAQVISYNPQFIASFILSDMALMHGLTKGAWEGVIFGSFATPPYDSDDPKVEKYRMAMEKYYPDVRWGVFPYGGFLYAETFLTAIAKLGDDITREGLIREMENLRNYDIQGVTVNYSPDNHQAQRSMQLLRCVGEEEYEELSGYIESGADITALIDELENM